MALEKIDSRGTGDLLRLKTDSSRSRRLGLFVSSRSGKGNSSGTSGRLGVVTPSVGVATGSDSNFGDSTDILEDGQVVGRETCCAVSSTTFSTDIQIRINSIVVYTTIQTGKQAIC